MKKILFIGNSHVGTLYYYYHYSGGADFLKIDSDFIGYPGGWGPPFDLNNDSLVFIRESPNALISSEGFDFLNHSLDNYSYIVLSAVGHCGDIDTPFIGLKSGLIGDFDPKIPNIHNLEFVTKSFFESSCESFYEIFDMTNLSKVLMEKYPGKVILQPVPPTSSNVIENEAWIFNQLYHKPVLANSYYYNFMYKFQKKLAHRHGGLILDPLFETDNFLTPTSWMVDSAHGNDFYAHQVFLQVKALL